MRIRRLLLFIGLGLMAVIILFFIFRQDSRADTGPAVTLCPGPDLYGYQCESGTGFSYIDATNDVQLYADDDFTMVGLPFPFIFYGTTYSEISISSNGNLQFGAQNPTFFNECLNNGPIALMGDLIAPFWDDLDSRLAGAIEIETMGDAPNRIFVVEWDSVPYFGGDLEDLITFEVQLFENSHDILFLYEDVSHLNASNGRSATIGIQSANQGLALQFSCNQPAVSDTSRIRIQHPEFPNEALGQTVVINPAQEPLALLQKGDLTSLTTQLNQQGSSALVQWQQRWLNEPSPKMGRWEWADLTGNGRSDLILMLNQPQAYSATSALLVFEAAADGTLSPAIYQPLSTRETAVSTIEHLQFADLTHDNQLDALFRTPNDNTFYLVTNHSGELNFQTIPEQCGGGWKVSDENGNGRLLLIRDGCQTPGRVYYIWEKNAFEIATP